MTRVKTSSLRLIVYDFDGVMTNNKVFVDQFGNESVQVDRADGLAVSEIKKFGIKQIIISTEKNKVVSSRADKLGIPCLQGIENKESALLNFCNKNEIDLKNTAFVGNDVNDLQAMGITGYTFCPADAHESIKTIANYTLKTRGGDGVIRELLDFIIK